jgi:hypothetical protein
VLTERLTLADALKPRGVPLRSLTEHLDTSTPSGGLIPKRNLTRCSTMSGCVPDHAL